MKYLPLWMIGMVLFSLYTSPASASECMPCHEKETPAAVSQWRSSRHAENVFCETCHGTDHTAIIEGRSPVDAKVCGQCHEKAYQEHVSSKHGLGLHSGWGCTRNLNNRNPRECLFCHEEGSTLTISKIQCARFLTQSSEMGSLGCNRCHQVENSCASCHSNHITDLATVTKPEVCATCHMGPDHPQWEMWQTSRHGVLFTALGESAGPTCQFCHMPEGTHDVSFGITVTPAMNFVDQQREFRREEMLTRCTECHGKAFSERELTGGDAILKQSKMLIEEAETIIRDLADRDLLTPSLSERPPHPLRGRELVLDGQMLYEDISHVERLFFKMKKYDLAKTVKGAFHQNPAYTHWYGNAELKMTLADIKAEAAHLKSSANFKRFAEEAHVEDSDYMLIEKELKVLKNKQKRGAISQEDYKHLKKELLEQLQ